MNQRFAARYAESKERDKKWLMQLNLAKVNNLLWPLYVGFICLNFLDSFSTILALNSGYAFYEQNFFAAKLFSLGPQGFLLATILKYTLALPLFYAVFIGVKEKYEYQIRLLKVGALAALVAADAFYIIVVFLNNIPNLLHGINV